MEITKGGWGQWKTNKCKSECIVKSKGFQNRSRLCDNPRPVNTDEGCEGVAYDVHLCKDEWVTKKKLI